MVSNNVVWMNKILLIMAGLLIATSVLGAAQTAPQASNSPYCTSGVIPQYSNWYCSVADYAIASYWSQWYPIALLAVFIAFGIAAILFAIGALAQNGRIRNFAIGEFYEATASAIIVIGFLFLSAVIIGLIPSLIVGPSNPYVGALGYMTNTISASQSLVSELSLLNLKFRLYASSNLMICFGGGPASPTASCDSTNGAFAFPAMFFFALPATTLMNVQTEGLALLYGEFYLIMLMMYAAIPVFLIPGVIFRALLPLRSLGGFMIAIAFGIFVIMPTLFSVASYFTNVQLQGQLAYTTSQLQQYGSGSNAVLNGISQQSPLVQSLNQIQNSLGAYWMSVLFYPALIFSHLCCH